MNDQIQHPNWQIPSFEIKLWSARAKRYCVIIPVINEGERIQKLLQRMYALQIHEQADIIIADGGSVDGSLEIKMLMELQVRGLLVKTGPGKLGAQLRMAYAFALDHGYDGILTIDGNNKDDPDAIPNFIKSLEDGYDFVQASRFIKGGIAENTPLSRTIAVRYIHAPLLSLSSGFGWTDTTQGFRAYSRRLLLDEKVGVFRNVFQTYELLFYLSHRAPQLGYRCIELPTARRYPANEKTPTKISAFSGNYSILKTLIKTCLGHYDA